MLNDKSFAPEVSNINCAQKSFFEIYHKYEFLAIIQNKRNKAEIKIEKVSVPNIIL